MKKITEPIYVTKSFLPPFEEYTEQIQRIWQSHWLTNNGQIHQEFEHGIRNYLGVENCSLLVNGHMALETALKNSRLEGEVITTPFTFVSTTHAIKNAGLTPVFCDISLHDFNIDVNKIEALITEKTSAIMPVHVFGNPCDVEKIEEIALKHGLKVIYDAAHAFGVSLNGKGIGNFGDISMFSLHATKVFNSIEGGVLTYNDAAKKREIDLYKNFGISGPETIEGLGINAKMNEFQAAMGLVNLRYIDSEITKRKEISDHYKSRLEKIEGISFLNETEGVRHNYAYFPILVGADQTGMNRDLLHDRLKEYNVMSRKYFYPLTSEIQSYKQENVQGLENAHWIADRILTLPIYSSLELELVDYICDAIQQAVQQ